MIVYWGFKLSAHGAAERGCNARTDFIANVLIGRGGNCRQILGGHEEHGPDGCVMRLTQRVRPISKHV